MRSSDEHYLEAQVVSSSATQYWDVSGHTIAYGCSLSDQNLSGKYEYGYSYYYTLISGLSIDSRECGGQRETRFESASVGIRGRLDDYANGKSWQIRLLYQNSYSSTNPLKAATSHAGFEAGLARSDHFWFSDQVGTYQHSVQYGTSIRIWSGGTAPQWYGHVKYTYTPVAEWMFSTALDASWQFDPGSTFTQSNNVFSDARLLKGTLMVSRKLSDEWWINGGIMKNLWGQSVSQLTGVFIYVSRTWQ